MKFKGLTEEDIKSFEELQSVVEAQEAANSAAMGLPTYNPQPKMGMDEMPNSNGHNPDVVIETHYDPVLVSGTKIPKYVHPNMDLNINVPYDNPKRQQSIQGWECPRCQKINSPLTKSCDCTPVKTKTLL